MGAAVARFGEHEEISGESAADVVEIHRKREPTGLDDSGHG